MLLELNKSQKNPELEFYFHNFQLNLMLVLL